MSIKTFTSQNGWFSLNLPIDWEEYDDGGEGTYAFFNSKSWTGNFRITPLRLTKPNDFNEDKAAEFIEDEIRENDGATKIKLGKLDFAYYKRDVKQDNDSLVVYYWVTGKNNNLFICSFSIDKNQELSKQNQKELQLVQKIIKSIKIN